MIIILSTVLIVDDIDINRMILRGILSEDYEVVEACNGKKAYDLLQEMDEMPQAILLDIIMPEMDGFELLGLLKAETRTMNIPVLFITASDSMGFETRGLQAGAVDYVVKPFTPEVVKARIDNQIKLRRYQTELEKMVAEKTKELVSTHEKVLETLANIIEYRSLESGEHIRRTRELTRILINELLKEDTFRDELIASDYEAIITASALHDIGKVGIPDIILLKPGKLTPEEFNLIKTHSIIGYEIIESMEITGNIMYYKHCSDICRHHHERWDGTGYPCGLAGEEIPLSARIISLVDVYDALVSKRCYKPEFSQEESFNIILKERGRQFQPEIVDKLAIVLPDFEKLEKDMIDHD